MTVGSAAVVAFAVTLATCPLVLRAIRYRVVDEPNDRSLHQTPTPRGGGLAVASGALVGAVLAPGLSSWQAPLFVAAFGFALLGLVDDLWTLPALTRLVAQLLVGAGALPLLLRGLSGPLPWKVVFSFGVLLWLVSCVNAFNFMDGINGISAVQILGAGGAWWFIGRAEDVPALAAAGLVIAACGLAFAPFNVPRARMFLGDVGSYFIGGWLAVLVVVGLRSGLPVEAVIAPVAIALADTMSTIVRRVRAGQTWHEAHSEHTYQRLVHAGWSHTATSAFVGTMVAVCSVAGASAIALEGSSARGLADLAIAAVVAAYLYSPNILAAAGNRTAAAQ
jgi:UDP-N-acetylmuramyl pentapeptide phosphotransferase/UDP-N-acetylglucosamine-1-phosphate transferase